MGGGAATSPLPPVTAEAIQQLFDLDNLKVVVRKDETGEAINEMTRALYKLLEDNKLAREVQEETNRLLREGLKPPSKWVSQDEAAVILGQTVKPSGNHLTHLKRYRKNGWLTIFSSCNPYRYSRKEVEALADDFHNDRKYPLAR